MRRKSSCTAAGFSVLKIFYCYLFLLALFEILLPNVNAVNTVSCTCFENYGYLQLLVYLQFIYCHLPVILLYLLLSTSCFTDISITKTAMTFSTLTRFSTVINLFLSATTLLVPTLYRCCYHSSSSHM